MKLTQMGGKKTVETGNLDEPQLYNLDEYVAEQKNVAAEYPDVVKELKELLK